MPNIFSKNHGDEHQNVAQPSVAQNVAQNRGCDNTVISTDIENIENSIDWTNALAN